MLVIPSIPSRHADAFDPDCIADWVISRFDEMASGTLNPPLVVPLTVTFAPMSVRPDRVLVEFERFYVRLCRQLINNYERPSKRGLANDVPWESIRKKQNLQFRSKL
jgi:hypothetical protein